MNNIRYCMFVIFGLFFIFGLAACDTDNGECLSHGENCAQSYIDANYGGKRPPCCNSDDACQSSPSGYYLTCN